MLSLLTIQPTKQKDIRVIYLLCTSNNLITPSLPVQPEKCAFLQIKYSQIKVLPKSKFRMHTNTQNCQYFHNFNELWTETFEMPVYNTNISIYFFSFNILPKSIFCCKIYKWVQLCIKATSCIICCNECPPSCQVIVLFLILYDMVIYLLLGQLDICNITSWDDVVWKIRRCCVVVYHFLEYIHSRNWLYNISYVVLP